ncbi:cytochrome oxidase small assembly protein [Aquabacterium sp.]
MNALQRRHNLRLALILASVAATFFVGFIVKIVLLGKG